MRYWVYGSDMTSGKPRDSLFIEAESEADARAQAKEFGMTVETVEQVEAGLSTPSGGAWPIAAMLREGDPGDIDHADGEDQHADGDDQGDAGHPLAEFLVVAFRVVAGVVVLLSVIRILNLLEAADQFRSTLRVAHVPVGASVVDVIVQGIVVVAFLLATAEFLRLGIALERNTRRAAADGKPPGDPGGAP